MKFSHALGALAVWSAAASPLWAQDAPKSNLIARAKVLSRNELSITIRFSHWGQSSAYQFAADHCAKFGKLAVPTTSSGGYDSDMTTTWVCQEPPKGSAPPQASQADAH